MKVLEATGLDDARQWLTERNGPGVVFCEASMSESEFLELKKAPDLDSKIAAFLSDYPNFVT